MKRPPSLTSNNDTAADSDSSTNALLDANAYFRKRPPSMTSNNDTEADSSNNSLLDAKAYFREAYKLAPDGDTQAQTPGREQFDNEPTGVQQKLSAQGIHNDDIEDDDFTTGHSEALARKVGFQNGLYPETEEDLKKAEEVLSNELATISIDEHEEAMFDVVGFRNNKEEDAAFLNTKLAELDKELFKISRKRKRAYEAACKLNPDYVRGKKFHLAFLRSQRFDAKEAAGVIINHFDMKQKVFANYPAEIQGREVKFTDLSPDAREFVEGGHLQVSASNDAAGRSVVFHAAFQKNYRTLESFQKQAIWYFMSCRSRNENVQQSGEVIVVYSGGEPEKMDIPVFLTQMRRAFASDIQAIHVCQTTMTMRFFLATLKLFLDNFTRFRLQEHRGTRQEINFALQTYGINTDDSPLRPDNTLDTTFHRKWLEAQKQYEENNFSQAILVPRRFDVLFGKSKQCTQHPGTMRCQLLAEINLEKYDKQGKTERNRIAEKIVHTIHESGGRFLKKDGNSATGAWEEVDFASARSKVTHFFRGLRERKQKIEKQPNMSTPKRGFDNGDENAALSTSTESLTTNTFDTSLISKRMRSPGTDSISESWEE